MFRRLLPLALAPLALAGCGETPPPVAPPPGPSEAAQPAPLFEPGELPGSYSRGDGFVWIELELLPEGRFTHYVWPCGEELHGEGRWWLEGDVIVREYEPSPAGGHPALPAGLQARELAVKWGEETFLVDEYHLPAFAAAAAETPWPPRTPREEWELRRGFDWTTAPRLDGELRLPERYRSFYEHGPVEATVLEVREDGLALLGDGPVERLVPGTRLAALNERINLVVEHVEAGEALARPLYIEYSERPIAPGDRFTTGDYSARPWSTAYETLPAPPSGGPASPEPSG